MPSPLGSDIDRWLCISPMSHRHNMIRKSGHSPCFVVKGRILHGKLVSHGHLHTDDLNICFLKWVFHFLFPCTCSLSKTWHTMQSMPTWVNHNLMHVITRRRSKAPELVTGITDLNVLQIISHTQQLLGKVDSIPGLTRRGLSQLHGFVICLYVKHTRACRHSCISHKANHSPCN
jgi:hypothetical protein